MTCRIAFVLFPDFQQLDLAGPLAVFEVAERYRPGSYTWRFCAVRPGPVRSSAGLPWPAQGLPRADAVDLVVLSGGDGVDDMLHDDVMQRWLRRVAARGVRVASICSGSLLLAQAGLLDGRQATTHWSRTRQFQQAYPRVLLLPDRIWTHDAGVWTSAGITAGIDLALALVGHDLGEPVARAAARQLVVYHRRPGGQSQFSPLLELQRGDGRFGALLEHVRSHLAQRHAVEDLAARACMSPRHFARAFRAETGTPPAQAVERLRVDAARAALESGAHSVQQVARDCGFGAPDRMRRAFVRQLGQPPSALRRQAAASADGPEARTAARPTTSR
jgi:transcriptional regulator GlxA family with amidase domain